MLAKKLDLDKLMMLHGPKARDYADLNHISKGLAFSALQSTESPMRAPFSEMLEGQGAVEVIDKNYVQWRIYGNPETRCMVFGDPNDPAVDYLGLNHNKFQVWVDFDFYKAGDVLAPVHNKTVEMVITSEFATPYEGGYLYDVVLKDSNPAFYFERIYFTPGTYLIKTGSVQSWESIGQFGSIQMAESFAYIEYRVPMTTMGWEFEIEAEAHRQWGSIAVARCDDEGRPILESASLTNYLESKAKMKIEEEIELSLIYGRQSEHLIDPTTGKQITTGPGLYEWMEYGQEVPYSPEVNGIDFMAEMFEALWFDRLPTASWSVELLTGQAGMRLFSSWVQEKFGSTATITDYDFVLKSRTPYDQRGGREGYAFVPPQFTEYVLPGYGAIRVAHWPALDDTRINTVNYPGSMYPVSSYEFIAMNSGFGEPNVKKLVRNDNRYQTYAVGYWSPYGAVNIDNPYFKSPDTNIGDAYKFLHRETFGLVVTDPELIVRFRPNVSA